MKRSPLRALLAVGTVLGAFLAVVAVGLVFRGGGGSDTSTVGVSEHPVAIPTSLRTVTVSQSMPMPSARPRSLSAKLEEGAMPAAPTVAKVVSDTDCTPDANMISHCRNEIVTSDGKSLVLRHPHNMHRIPCLAPGEMIRLVPAPA